LKVHLSFHILNLNFTHFFSFRERLPKLCPITNNFQRLTITALISLERVHYSPQDWNFTTNWMRAPSLHMFKQLKGKKCSIFSKIVSINSMVCKLADVKTFWLKLKTKWREPLCIYLLKRFRYVKLEMYISVSQVIEFLLWGVMIKLNILEGNYYILWIMPSRRKLSIILQNIMFLTKNGLLNWNWMKKIHWFLT
jgi:hypothetical protein